MKERLPVQIFGCVLRDRVKIVAAQFPATTFDELFERTKAVQWEKFLPVDAEFPVKENQ